MPQLDKDMLKEATKEAISDWLDKQFATLGKWTLGGICSAGLAALTYWILTNNGWHK
jgi:hypothetical protein